MNSAPLRRILWCVLLLACFTGSVRAASIYSLTTSLVPLNGSEFASGSVALSVDTVSTLTLGISYQFQSRAAVLATLSAGGSSLLVASGLPGLSTLLYPFGAYSTTVVVDSAHFQDPASVLSSLLGQSVSISLTTTAGVLVGSGFLQGDRQGGGPPFPDFGDVPEPSTFGFAVAGLLLITTLCARRRMKAFVRIERGI
jgi:hypothetical protein